MNFLGHGVGGAVQPRRPFEEIMGDVVSESAQMLRKLENAAVSLLMVVISTVTLAQVVFRFVLKMPLAWSDELATFSFVWLALLGSVIAVREKGHIGVDAFVRLFPDRLRGIISLGMGLLLLLFFAAMCKFGVDLLRRVEDQRSAAMGIQIYWVYLAMPVCAALMFLHTLPELRVLISGVRAKRLPS